jgi:hypothetical protein
MYQIIPEFGGHRCLALLAEMKTVVYVVAVVRRSIWLISISKAYFQDSRNQVNVKKITY